MPTSPMTRPFHSAAFSLVEVLVALAILVLGIITLFRMVSGSLHRVRVDQPLAMARLLALEAIEQVRAVPFHSLPFGRTVRARLVPGRPSPEAFLDEARRTLLLLGSYPVELDLAITAVPLAPADRLARLDVTVTWEPSMPGPRTSRQVVLIELVENRIGHRELR